MNAVEVNALLAYIEVVFDARMKQTPEDRAERARGWARVLADVSPLDARRAAEEFYATETRLIMPADIRERLPEWRGASDAGDVTAQRLEREAQQAVTS